MRGLCCRCVRGGDGGLNADGGFAAGGYGDAVAGGALDEVHGGVGGANDVLPVVAVVWEGGDAEAGADAEPQVVIEREDFFAEAFVQVLCDGLGL